MRTQKSCFLALLHWSFSLDSHIKCALPHARAQQLQCSCKQHSLQNAVERRFGRQCIISLSPSPSCEMHLSLTPFKHLGKFQGRGGDIPWWTGMAWLAVSFREAFPPTPLQTTGMLLLEFPLDCTTDTIPSSCSRFTGQDMSS